MVVLKEELISLHRPGDLRETAAAADDAQPDLLDVFKGTKKTMLYIQMLIYSECIYLQGISMKFETHV